MQTAEERKAKQRIYCKKYRLVHHEELLARKKADRISHHEQNRVPDAARSRAHYALHIEEGRMKGAAYYASHSDGGKARAKKWALEHPNQKRVNVKRSNAKHRTLGFISLNVPFIGCEGHHVDKEHVVYVPAALHKSVPHNVWTGRNMETINSVVYQWLAKETP